MLIMKIISVRLFQKTVQAMNAHQVCCEDNPTVGLIVFSESRDLVFHSRSQLRLKLDTFVTSTVMVINNISDNIEAAISKLGRTVNLCMAYI